MMRRWLCVTFGFLCAWASLSASGPALVDAAKSGDLAAVRSLLKGGADPNSAAPDGSTAVHWAVHRDHLEMLNALLAAGAKPDVVTRYKVAPLTLAAQNGNAAAIERLLDAGAKPDTVS
jgi:ankyrin repeat protein